jgi:MFS family permease
MTGIESRAVSGQGPIVLPRRQIVAMVTALVLAVVSFALNASMVSPAYHDINTQLGPEAFVTMSTFFYLAGAVANVVLIRWSDYIGRRRVLLIILVVLVIGTVLCVVATSLPLFVVGRALQGTSNITYGLAFLIMRERLSGPMFGVCCGIMASVNGGVAGTDALLGGVLVDRFGYRSIFVVILVVCLAALAFAWRSVPADNGAGVAGATGRMDWIGAVLIALGVCGINMYFSRGGRFGWLSTPAAAWLAVAAVALIALVVIENRVAHPLAAMKHMRSREAWPLILVTILVMASFMVVLGLVVPALAEDPDSGFGHSATMAALLFITPAAGAQVLTSPLIGRLAVRIDFVTLLRAGLAGGVAVVILLALVVKQQTLVTLVMILFGVAFGMMMTAMSSLGVLQASDEEPGALPGISNACYGIGASLGFAWAGPLIVPGTVSSFHDAIWICVGIGVLALIFSVVLRPKRVPEFA